MTTRIQPSNKIGPVAGMKATEKEELIRYLDDTERIIQSMPVINTIVSTIFFLYMFLDTSVELVGKYLSEEHKNILSFILSLSPINLTRRSEILIAQVFDISYTLVVLFLSMLTMLSSPLKYPMMRYYHIVVMYEIYPCFHKILANAIYKSLLLMGKDDIDSIVNLQILCHLVFVMYYVYITAFNGIGPHIINHVFFTARPLHSTIIILYMFIVSHVLSFSHDPSMSLCIVTIILSLCMVAYASIMTPYYFRYLNGFLISYAIFNAIVHATILFPHQWPAIAPIEVGISLFLGFYIAFVVHPIFICKNDPYTAVNEYVMCDKTILAKMIVERMKLSTIRPFYLRTLVQIALYLKPNNIQAILKRFGEIGIRDFADSYFAWSCSKLYAQIRDKVDEDEVKKVDYQVKSIEQLERQFWHQVWLSDRPVFIEFGSILARRKIRLFRYLDLHSKWTPRLTEEWLLGPKMASSYQQYLSNERQNFFRNHFHTLDIFFVLFSLIVMFFILFLFIENLDLTKELPAFDKIFLFLSSFDQFQGDVWDRSVFFGSGLQTLWNRYQHLKELASESGIINNFLSYKSNGQNTSVIFENFYSCVSKTTPLTARCFEDLTLLNHLNSICDNAEKLYTKDYIVQGSLFTMSFYIVMILIICLSIIVSILVFYYFFVKLKRKYDGFLCISKSKLVDLNLFDVVDDSMSYFPIKRSFDICNVFSSLILYLVFFFIGIVFFVGMTAMYCHFVKHDMVVIQVLVSILTNQQRLQMYLSYTITSYFVGKDNYDSLLANLDNIIQSFSYHEGMLNGVPDDLYVFLTQLHLNSTINMDIPRITSLTQILQKNYTHSAEVIYSSKNFFTIRFIHFFCAIIAMYALCRTFQVSLTHYMTAEMHQTKHLLSEIPEDEEELSMESFDDIDPHSKHEFTPEKIKIDFENVPLPIFTIDRYLRVNDITAFTTNAFKLQIGSPLRNGRFTPEFYSSLTSSIERSVIIQRAVKLNHQDETWVIDPFFTVFKNKKRFQDAVVAVFHKAPVLEHEIINLKKSLFYKIYPQFVAMESEFPLFCESTGITNFFIIIVQLVGLHDWESYTDSKILTTYRREVSNEFDKLVNESELFTRIRESNDIFIYGMNRTDAPKISVWKQIEETFDFGQAIIKTVNWISKKYGTNISGKVVVTKQKEPNWFITNRRKALVDLESDNIFSSETFLEHTIPNYVNYVTIRKESIANATKLKSCNTSFGIPFDIFLLV